MSEHKGREIRPVADVIRYHFGGADNSGMRARLRNCVTGGYDEYAHTLPADRVRGLASTVALTPLGLAGLEAVARACEEAEAAERY